MNKKGRLIIHPAFAGHKSPATKGKDMLFKNDFNVQNHFKRVKRTFYLTREIFN